MQMHRPGSRLCLLLLSLSLAVAANAAPYAEYRVTIVGPANSWPIDINQAGAVVGLNWLSGSNYYRSWVNYGTSVKDLGLLGGISNVVAAINDQGEVLGNWTTSDGQQRGYVYHRGGFRHLAGVNGRPTTYLDINNAGYILASSNLPATPPDTGAARRYLRAPNGSYRDLGAPAFPDLVLRLNVLNNRNQVAGSAAPAYLPEIPFNVFFWNKGVLRQIDSFGHTPNVAADINDCGQIAGYTSTESFREALATVWTNGRPKRIDTRPSSQYRYSTAEGINNHGHVVGTSDHLGFYVYRGKRMESLNALIAPNSGWKIDAVRAINDAGQIAARGVLNGVAYAVRLDLLRPHALGAPPIAPDIELHAEGWGKAVDGQP